MPDGDLVAEEPGRACAGVGDQGLLLAEFQREVFTQELSEAGFCLLFFGLGSGESQEMVIALCFCGGEGPEAVGDVFLDQASRFRPFISHLGGCRMVATTGAATEWT